MFFFCRSDTQESRWREEKGLDLPQERREGERERESTKTLRVCGGSRCGVQPSTPQVHLPPANQPTNQESQQWEEEEEEGGVLQVQQQTEGVEGESSGGGGAGG